MKDNRMDNIVECAYNMDNGYVEVWFTDGNMLRIKCEEVEAALRTTEQSLAKLHRLLDNKPIEYVVMALSGEMQAYCDIEDDMVKGMFASMLTLGNCIGSITGPIVFSKIKNVKVFVSGAAVLSFAGIIMCWRFPSIFVLHILVLYTGIMLGASMPIFLSAPVLLEGLGTKYAGSAAGVISTLQLLGAVLIPTYILTPIAGENYSLLFMLASICMVIMFLCGLLLPQFGNNQK